MILLEAILLEKPLKKEIETIMIHTQLNTVAKKGKLALISHQKTFNRLIKTVQNLQAKQKATIRDIDLALQFYYDTIKPNEAVLSQHLIERIKIAYQLYKTPKALAKRDRELFKMWLTAEIKQVCSMNEQSQMPDDIKKIFKEITGSHYEEDLAADIEMLQNKFQNEFGMDVDLSDIDLQGSQDDILRNIFFKMGQAAFQKKENSQEPRKTKKQLEKESKRQAIIDMQTKSLQTMYKQLVRVLHPDLERDNQKRIWKEELMKKLTVAYEKNDLYSLLTIEMEWMNACTGKVRSQTDEDLKIYNAILKDQIKELQMNIDMLFMHPRNLPIQKFYANGFDGISSLKKKATALKKFIKEIQDTLPALQTPQAKTILKKIVIDEFAMQNFMSQGSMTCTCGNC